MPPRKFTAAASTFPTFPHVPDEEWRRAKTVKRTTKNHKYTKHDMSIDVQSVQPQAMMSMKKKAAAEIPFFAIYFLCCWCRFRFLNNERQFHVQWCGEEAKKFSTRNSFSSSSKRRGVSLIVALFSVDFLNSHLTASYFGGVRGNDLKIIDKRREGKKRASAIVTMCHSTLAHFLSLFYMLNLVLPSSSLLSLSSWFTRSLSPHTYIPLPTTILFKYTEKLSKAHLLSLFDWSRASHEFSSVSYYTTHHTTHKTREGLQTRRRRKERRKREKEIWWKILNIMCDSSAFLPTHTTSLFLLPPAPTSTWCNKTDFRSSTSSRHAHHIFPTSHISSTATTRLWIWDEISM